MFSDILASNYRKRILFLFLLGSTVCSFGQENITDTISSSATDTTLSYRKGWEVFPFPVALYSSDLGFSVGGYASFINLGDGSLYPDYKDHFEILLRYNTNKSGIGQLIYDSEYLIPKFRTTFNATYAMDKMFAFYGFNGYESLYIRDMNKAFYAYNRDQVKFTFDLQGSILENLKWVGGLSFYHYKIHKVDLSKYRNDVTLYDLYRQRNIIFENESEGGDDLYIKVGFFYDTRDFERAPSKGIATELTFMGTPDFFRQGQYSHIKFSIIHRQFISIIPKYLVLAYRLAYQGTLVGDAPWYVQQTLHTIFPNKTYYDGIGGESSVRGILANRVVGNGMFWANIESRIRVVGFRLLKQDFHIAMNPFFDCGMVIQKYRENELKEAEAIDGYNFVSGYKEKLHKTLGVGGKLIMNENFILSVEVGFALNGQDGGYGLYAGMNYIF